MKNVQSPLNERNIMKKKYKYNNITNNNYFIKDPKDLSQEKTKPIRRNIKIKKNNITQKYSIDLPLYNKDNENLIRLKYLLFNSHNSFINNDTKKEINNNLDMYNNEFKVNNYMKIFNQKHSIESVEWMYYNNLTKNILFNRQNLVNNKSVNMFPINSFKYKKNIKKNFQFPTLFIDNKKRLIKTDKNKSTINRNRIVIDVKGRKNFEKKNLNEEEKFNFFNINIKKRKLIEYNFLSQSGNYKGYKKINQDCYLTLSNINNCENISLYGILNGHGPYGDILSKEISEFFFNYFTQRNIFNTIEDLNTPRIEIKKLAIITSKKNNLSQKISFEPKNDFKFQKLINDKVNQKINDTYKILTKDNFFKIFESFNEIDKILHEKYKENKKCDDSGTSLNLIININSNNINKIISINLGNTKSILITDDKKIKELNIIHTPCVKEERIRIENHGGVIDRIDWLQVGPLRVWFKGKKFPGLTLTRSLGDFEAIPLGIIPIPDIKEYDIDEEKIKILIMATNGIWEFLTNDKVMDIA